MDDDVRGPGRTARAPRSRRRWVATFTWVRPWLAAGWAAAGLLAAAALLFPVLSEESPAVGSSTSGQGEVTRFSTVTTFDAWGNSATLVDPPSAHGGFQVPGGPTYGPILLACAFVLLAAAISSAAPGKFGLRRGTAAAAPVAAGALAGVGVCQILAFQAASRPFTPDGVTLNVMSFTNWRLGPSPWITIIGAVVALTIWVLACYETRTVGRVELAADPPRHVGPPTTSAPPPNAAPVDQPGPRQGGAPELGPSAGPRPKNPQIVAGTKPTVDEGIFQRPQQDAHPPVTPKPR